MLFHDIHDSTTLLVHRGGGGGGVPSFWRQLTRSVHPARLASFIEQHATSARQFGLGMVSPNARGTAEPDDVAAYAAWGRGLAAWRSLCAVDYPLCRHTECVASRRCRGAWARAPREVHERFFDDNATWEAHGRPLIYAAVP